MSKQESTIAAKNLQSVVYECKKKLEEAGDNCKDAESKRLFLEALEVIEETLSGLKMQSVAQDAKQHTISNNNSSLGQDNNDDEE